MSGWYTIGSEEALMSVTDAEAIADVADRLFEAIEQSDIAMIEQLWNDDVVVWKVADRERDRERALRVLSWFINATTDRRYEILDRQLFEYDCPPSPQAVGGLHRRRAGGFVQQHILHASGRNGGSIAMRVCIVIKLGANGLISRIDEYFDPAEMAPLVDS
jgi:ketosteroid isomerase-like protein